MTPNGTVSEPIRQICNGKEKKQDLDYAEQVQSNLDLRVKERKRERTVHYADLDQDYIGMGDRVCMQSWFSW